MIHHLVAFQPRAGEDLALAAVMDGLSDLVGVIDGFLGFDHGPNIDLEGKSQAYPYGFICRFADKTALMSYADDPRHQALGARLVALCENGADGITVFDLQTGAGA